MAVFFDFDGTLFHTLPDLLYVLNNILQQRLHPIITAKELKSLISAGSKSILRHVLPNYSEPQLDELQQQLLRDYVATNYARTKPYSGIKKLLRQLNQAQIPWGVVTNRHSYLTYPLLEKFNLMPTSGCVVGIDHVTKPKPDPEPLLLASSQLKLLPQRCIYIGDAVSDIIAGNSAGMTTIAALFGYVPNKQVAQQWPADYHLHRIADIFPVIQQWQRQLPA